MYVWWKMVVVKPVIDRSISSLIFIQRFHHHHHWWSGCTQKKCQLINTTQQQRKHIDIWAGKFLFQKKKKFRFHLFSWLTDSFTVSLCVCFQKKKKNGVMILINFFFVFFLCVCVGGLFQLNETVNEKIWISVRINDDSSNVCVDSSLTHTHTHTQNLGSIIFGYYGKKSHQKWIVYLCLCFNHQMMMFEIFWRNPMNWNSVCYWYPPPPPPPPTAVGNIIFDLIFSSMKSIHTHTMHTFFFLDAYVWL